MIISKQTSAHITSFAEADMTNIVRWRNKIKDGFKMWSESPDGFQNIAPGYLMPMMVKAVQELSAKVEALENA